MCDLRLEALHDDEAVIRRFRPNGYSPAELQPAKEGLPVRSPALIGLTLTLALAGDRLHWIGYVLAGVAFVATLIVLVREVDQYADEISRVER